MMHNETPQTRHIDGLLTAFFRSQTPAQWPPCPKPKTPPVRAASSFQRWWKQSTRQLIVAASVALLLGGYWLLAHHFPESAHAPLSGPNVGINPDGVVAPDEGLKPVENLVSPKGNSVVGQDNGMEDGTFRGVFQGLPDLPDAPPTLQNTKPSP